jgi:hypothetical protein
MRTRSVVLLLVLLAAVSLVLGAGLAILIWSIPDGGGIGAGLLALGSMTLVAAAGLVAMVVLVGNLLPRTRGRVWPWALAGVAAWVVGPAYIGGAIGGTVDGCLDAKYSSPDFVADYVARLPATPMNRRTPSRCVRACTRFPSPSARKASRVLPWMGLIRLQR